MHPTQKSSHSFEPSSTRDWIGRTVGGRWILQAELGQGGMGTVFAAVHARNGRRAALKILSPAMCGEEALKQRFLEEAFATNQVGHPGVVQALDDGTLEDGTPFLVLEMLEGETLEDIGNKRGGRLTEREVLDLATVLLDIVHCAHTKGVLHRDIKPENVFITISGQVKLLDFGIAKVEGKQRSFKTEWSSPMGTPAFMPPEQARGRWGEVDVQSDLWSLGATLFTVLTGRLVHEAETTNETLMLAMCHRAPKVLDVSPQTNPALAFILDRALEPRKADRYSTAAEMLADVHAVRQGLGLDHAVESSTFDPDSTVRFVSRHQRALRLHPSDFDRAADLDTTASHPGPTADLGSDQRPSDVQLPLSHPRGLRLYGILAAACLGGGLAWFYPQSTSGVTGRLQEMATGGSQLIGLADAALRDQVGASAVRSGGTTLDSENLTPSGADDVMNWANRVLPLLEHQTTRPGGSTPDESVAASSNERPGGDLPTGSQVISDEVAVELPLTAVERKALRAKGEPKVFEDRLAADSAPSTELAVADGEQVLREALEEIGTALPEPETGEEASLADQSAP